MIQTGDESPRGFAQVKAAEGLRSDRHQRKLRNDLVKFAPSLSAQFWLAVSSQVEHDLSRTVRPLGVVMPFCDVNVAQRRFHLVQFGLKIEMKEKVQTASRRCCEQNVHAFFLSHGFFSRVQTQSAATKSLQQPADRPSS